RSARRWRSSAASSPASPRTPGPHPSSNQGRHVERDDQPSSSVHALQRRVLLLPPTHRDAEAMRKVLSLSGMECVVFHAMTDVCRALTEGAAVLIVSEEALFAEAECLHAWLEQEPVWSDLPVIVLSRWGSESPELS